MATYRLGPQDGSIPYRKITCGRRWVGRVLPHQEGGWLGIIGKTSVRRSTMNEAFDDVVAQHLGYKSGEHLRQRNAAVRQRNRMVGAAADHAVQEFNRGNLAPMDEMLTTPGTATAVLAAFTRDLRRRLR